MKKWKWFLIYFIFGYDQKKIKAENKKHIIKFQPSQSDDLHLV